MFIFHVLPRYSETQHFGGTEYPDPGWPAAPEISKAVTPQTDEFAELGNAIRAVWPSKQGGKD